MTVRICKLCYLSYKYNRRLSLQVFLLFNEILIAEIFLFSGLKIVLNEVIINIKLSMSLSQVILSLLHDIKTCNKFFLSASIKILVCTWFVRTEVFKIF